MKRMIRLPTTAMLLLAWLYFSSPAHADQNATWVGFTSDWNNPFNWTGTPQTVPTGTATFDATGITKSLTIPGGATIEALQFNAPNYTFNIPDALAINGTGINASLANAPTFNVIGTPGHSTPPINFNNFSSAGTAQIVLGPLVAQNGFEGGFINFRGNSTADQATITVRDQSATNFMDSSTAFHATLIVDNNGFVGFVGTSDGAQATIINNAGGEVKIANLTTGGTSFGSIAGAGTYNLGSKQLTVGSNDNSTTVDGVIEDHFPGVNLDQVGGSLVKVGTGTLTLLNDNNSYSGGTRVEDGTLVVGTLDPTSEVSTALGPGNFFVVGGTLRTTSATTGNPLTIKVGGNYTQDAGGTLALGIGGLQGEQYDHVQVGGNASLNGTLVVSSLNNFHPVAGDAFEVLRTNGTRSGNFSVVNDSAFNNNPNISPQ